MRTLLDRNLEAFGQLSETERLLSCMFLNCGDEEEVETVSKDKVDLVKALKKVRKDMDAGVIDSDKRDDFNERYWNILRDRLSARFPQYYAALRKYQDDDCEFPSAVCRFQKPHIFRVADGSWLSKHMKQFSTRLLSYWNDDIMLGAYDLWDNLDAIRVKDLEWLLDAVATMECGEIEIQYGG